MIRAYDISPAPEKLLPRNGGTAIGDGLRLAQALGAAITERHEELLRPSAQPRRHENRPAVAAALRRRAGGRRHRHRRTAARASPTKALAASGSPTPSPACPTRSAPRCDFRPADLGRTAGRNHVQPPNPLLQEAGGTLHRAGYASRSWPALGRRAGDGPGRDGRAVQRRARRRHAAESFAAAQRPDTSPGRSGRRRSMRCRSASRSPTPWAASWWTATAACSTRTTSRSRASTPPARPSAGSMAARTPATSAG